MNFQNVPRDNKVVKRAIIPKRGAFSYLDYSQIEPRLFAYFVAKTPPQYDTTIVDWYREGRDVYVEIASRAMGKDPAVITEDERQMGKVWFLMSLYGAGPKKISEQIGMDIGAAKKFYRAFHDGLPQIKNLSNPRPTRPGIPWTPGAIERAYSKRGCLKTPWGRHLHAEPWGEHKLLNKLIQGSAADLMKSALIRVDAWLQQNPDIESRMVSVIHDEIIFDGPPSELELLHQNVPGLMREDFLTEVLPIDIDHEVSLGSWADKVPYEEWRTQSK